MQERSLWLHDVAESDLVPLMRDFTARYPALKLFSLPRLGERRAIQLGLRGREGLDAAFGELRRAVVDAGFVVGDAPDGAQE